MFAALWRTTVWPTSWWVASKWANGKGAVGVCTVQKVPLGEFGLDPTLISEADSFV
jgi:hypothetical protein